MNSEHFVVVTGIAVEALLDARQRAEVRMVEGGCFASEPLCDFQRRVSAEGYVAAELVKSIYGWTLRYASGLQGWGIIRATRSHDFNNACNVAAEWVARDSDHRYVFVRRAALLSVDA